jgi:transcription termination factor Rho
MATSRSRSSRRPNRKPRTLEANAVEEFDRDQELADVEFEEDEAFDADAAEEEQAEASSRTRRSPPAQPSLEDDFGADIVADESVPAPPESGELPAVAGEALPADSNGADEARPYTSQGEDGGQKRGRRRRRRGRGQQEGGSYEQRGAGQQTQTRGRFEQRGQRGGHRHDRNRQQRGRYQKAPVGESHEPPVMSGTFEGVLELHPKRYGFLRTAANDYGAVDTDPFVSSSLVEKYNLREGVKIIGEVGPGVRGQGPRLLEVVSIDGRTPEEYQKIKHFDQLTPINPFEQIKLETGPQPITMRVMDLLTPIGKGQRALIVAPPRTGKTMLLQDIANAVSKNHPEIHLIVLLIDERPEEVTEMRRMVRGEVVASSMDRDVESHVRISQLVVERGKRIAESGRDCFILLDSITRCARAFNKWVGGGRDAKIQTGGLDVRAMEIPRKMFGTARRFDEGGSLTVCATALIDTGSRMDDAIFQEFKGTGNMELVLSRELADRRIWPAIDITKSGTRREEKLLPPDVLEGVTMLRRALVSMSPVDAMIELTKKLAAFPTNAEFLARVRQVL